jgi:hypothetical protein
MEIHLGPKVEGAGPAGNEQGRGPRGGAGTGGRPVLPIGSPWVLCLHSTRARAFGLGYCASTVPGVGVSWPRGQDRCWSRPLRPAWR